MTGPPVRLQASSLAPTNDVEGDAVIIGFVGAGYMAQTLARGWLAAGHQVRLANSRGPDTLTGVVRRLGPGAGAAATADLAAECEVIVLALWWWQAPAAIAALGPVDGRIVIDTVNNRRGPGPRDVIDIGGRTSSEVIAEMLPGAKVVKAFSHLPISATGALADHPGTRAMFLAGDDAAAKAVVAGLIRDLGGIPADTGSLVGGGRLQGVGGPLSGHGRALTLAEAERIRPGIIAMVS